MSDLRQAFEARLQKARERQQKIEQHEQDVKTHSKLKSRATWENKPLTSTETQQTHHHLNNKNNPLLPPHPVDNHHPSNITQRKDTATLLKEEEEEQRRALNEKRNAAILKHTQMIKRAMQRQVEREAERSQVVEQSQRTQFERDCEEVRQYNSHIRARDLTKEWEQQQKDAGIAKFSNNSDDYYEVSCGLAAYFDQRQQDTRAKQHALKQQTRQNLEAQIDNREEALLQEERKNAEEAMLRLKQIHIDTLKAEGEELQRVMEERRERQEELQEAINQRNQWRHVVKSYHSHLDTTLALGSHMTMTGHPGEEEEEEKRKRREDRRAALEQDLKDHDQCQADLLKQEQEEDREHLDELKRQVQLQEAKLKSIQQQRHQAIQELLEYNTKQLDARKKKQQQDKEESKLERQALEIQLHNDMGLSQSVKYEDFSQELLHKLHLEAQIGAKELRKKGEVAADIERAAAEAKQAQQLAQRVARSINDHKYLYPNASRK